MAADVVPLTRRRVVAAKIETTEGTAETLQASDGGILAIKPKFSPDIKTLPRKVSMATLSNLADAIGGQAAKMSFSVEAKGPGSAYSSSVLPALDKYLRACGFAATIVTTSGSETVTYKRASSGIPSLTLAGYEDGVIKSIVGARGNVKINAKANEAITFDFDFEGVWGGILDGALLAPTYEATKPIVFINAGTVTLASFSPKVSEFGVDFKNKLALRDNPLKAAGFHSAVITEGDPSGKLNAEFATIATYDWHGLWKAGTVQALAIGPLGPAQYNKISITAPGILYRKISDSDKNGIAHVDAEFQLPMSTGDDEISIIFS